MTLSIVMPTYNDAKYIRQALDSILNQSYPDFELIIVNDASSDETDTVIREYTQDRRIKYLINPTNQGVVRSVNRGCYSTSGKYIITASSDDYLNEGVFETGVALLEKYPDKSLCFFDVATFTGNRFERNFVIPGTLHPTPFSPSEMMRIHKKYNFFVPSCGTIVKKTALERVNYFNEAAGYLCDFIAYTQIALEGGAIYVPAVGTFFRFVPLEESRHANVNRTTLLAERSKILSNLKTNKRLFRLLCYSTALPRIISFSMFTLFLRPKHWDMALPMIWVKFKLMFTKIIRKRRERISFWYHE